MERPILIAELGSGGMADVYLAMRRGHGGFVKLFVVKQLRSEGTDEDAMAMFYDEARITSLLDHPNIVQTKGASHEDGVLRLEMEYLEGQPLSRLVHRARKTGRPLSVEACVSIVREALLGLHYAHELASYDGTPLSIVHRDVSPQNIFVTYTGGVKVVDFGIARAAGRVAQTMVGTVKGKVRYMAPEQALGKTIDRRTDIFAAGIVLWQLLVGETYWAGSDEVDIYRRLTGNDLPPGPRTRNPNITEALDAVCARALAWDPKDRFATAAEFEEALEKAVPTKRGIAREVGALAADLFADVRELLKAEVEKAMARPPEKDPDEDEPTKLFKYGPSGDYAPAMPSITSPAVAQSAPPQAKPKVAWNVPLPLTVAATAAVVFAAVFATVRFTESAYRQQQQIGTVGTPPPSGPVTTADAMSLPTPRVAIPAIRAVDGGATPSGVGSTPDDAGTHR